jgi:microcystin-dependent protein
MSTCSNCYNGCTEIVSDRCVKYTGINVPVLGIQTGDSLSFVEQALITFLTSTLDGTGVKIDLAGINVCEVVNKYLPTCKDLSIVDISKALIEAACDLQGQVDAIDATLATLNADYTIGCLTGVTASSDTHAIVQAVINKLCQVQLDLTALALNLATNYSSNGAQLNAYIANYLATNAPSSSLISNRMVPYAVVEYYGPVAGNFDGTGKGVGDWDKIYLCNGLNGTPDKRGVVGVGATNGEMLGLTMPAATNPTLGNPLYTVAGAIVGSNNVTLTIGQMPSHNHPGSSATTVISPNPHTHVVTPNNPGFVSTVFDNTSTGPNGFITEVNAGGPLLADNVTLTANTNVTIAAQGGGQAHPNFQPGLGCLYIQYRP